MSISPIVKYRTLAIAKSLTPIDTGNLRHNATKLSRVKENSWSINYSSSDAYYVGVLEDGAKYKNGTIRAPRKFIERTSLVLARYLTDYFNGKPRSKWAGQRLRQALKTSPNNIERTNRLFESQNKLGNIKWR